METKNSKSDNQDHGDTNTIDEKAAKLFEEEETGGGVQFSPPLYIQRYTLAVDYLTTNSIQKVVDFGCSECGFFQLLSTVPSLQEISLVDVDRDLLISKTRVISPDLKDYVHRRSNPLRVSMYAGSAADFDQRMKDVQAVTMIEIIEHLYPDVLKSVTHNVFGTLHPPHVVVTTPNSEFNVLFGNEDPTAFRHWDHKFEWTRGQFQEWCQGVCNSYGYEVEYSGVGFQSSIQKMSDLGPCSQAAFFKRRVEQEIGYLPLVDHRQEDVDCKNVYELIAQTEFPYDECKLSVEERLDMEIMYTLRQIARLRVTTSEDKSDDEDDNYDNGSFCINIRHLGNRSNIKRLASLPELRNHLAQKSFEISEDGESLTVNASQFMDTSSDEDDVDDLDDCIAQVERPCLCKQLNDIDKDNPDQCDDVVKPNKNSCCCCYIAESEDVEECWDTEDTAVT